MGILITKIIPTYRINRPIGYLSVIIVIFPKDASK